MIRARRAVTLVELLAALALSSFLLMAVLGLVVGTQRAFAALQPRLPGGNLDDVRIDLLAEDLAARAAAGDLEVHGGLLRLVTLHSLHGPRPVARRLVLVDYLVEDGALIRRERSPDAADASTLRLGAVASLGLAVHDGQSWSGRWPLRTPRTARALRVSLGRSDGTSRESILPLAPLAWSRHDD